MNERKHVALVAHDNRKTDLIEWATWNHRTLLDHDLICTGTTGDRIERALADVVRDEGLTAQPVNMRKLKSGPLGGDQQLGARISEGGVDALVFFWDPMQPHPHDVDVKALLRIAVLYNVPTACNRSSADFLISSPLMNQHYQPMFESDGERSDQNGGGELVGETSEP
ncbi:MAG: methylglyoxal synthase [Trueperaceae bacterium]|nr:methylglyoxal synthase [Trueperaceae bacterium]